MMHNFRRRRKTLLMTDGVSPAVRGGKLCGNLCKALIKEIFPGFSGFKDYLRI